MADNTNPSLFGNIARFFKFKWLRSALSWGRRADKQFTGSAEGIGDAFDLEGRRLKSQWDTLSSAIGEFAASINVLKTQRDNFLKQKADETEAFNGALSAHDRAEEAKDEKKASEIYNDMQQMQANIDRYQAQADKLQKSIDEKTPEFEKLKGRLSDLSDRIRNLKSEKASAISQYVSDDAQERLNKQLLGVMQDDEASPLDAVNEALAAKHARVQVGSEIAGTDSSQKRKDYVKEGKSAEAASKLDAILAARKAEKAGKTGAATDAPAKETDGGGAKPADRPKF